MKANIIVNYVVCGVGCITAGLLTLPYGWSHVAATALSAGLAVATGYSGTTLTVRAIRSK